MPFGVAAAAIGAGGAIAGGLISSSANKAAADTASAGQVEAAQITADANSKALDKELAANQAARDEYRQAADRGIADIGQGVADYTTTISPLLTPAPITLPTYRDLTDQQQIGEKDLLRNADATVAASGLRGAGRAGVGAILDADSRYQAGARSANDASTLTAKQNAQGVANSARGGLAGVQAQAGGSKANTELLTGNQLGSSLTLGGQQAGALAQSTGQAAANAATSSADTQAKAGIANGSIAAGTIGNIAGSLANPYALGGGNPNVPGLTSNTSYIDSGSFDA